MRKTGQVDSPLHGGRAPRWLFKKMVKLSQVFIEAVVTEFGPDKFIDMMSDPYWFQSFGSFLGFDWHSSGLTTTTLGAVKVALNNLYPGIGIFIAGGKGKSMRKTPLEIDNTGKYLQVNPNSIKNISKITAKVDSAWIQDGYNIYHHNIIYTSNGNWVVIQQGMNTNNKYARRYHWHHSSYNANLTQPHTAIESEQVENNVLNLVSPQAEQTKNSIINIFKEVKPSELEYTLQTMGRGPTLFMPKHHFVKLRFSSNLKKVILSTYDNIPTNPEQLALSRLGPASIRALTMASVLLYGTTPDFTDPAVFSYAHGGKDGHPYPVNLKIYENTITILERLTSKDSETRKQAQIALKRLLMLFK